MRASFVPATALALGLGCLSAAPTAAHPYPGQELPAVPELSGFSVLPADTFVPDSEPSGLFLDDASGAAYPGQPVQGFSGVHANGDGTWWAMSDNGFGNKANSRDFLLSVHRIAPDLEGGRTQVLESLQLSDPEGHVPWDIWRDGGCEAADDLPAGYECPAPDRILTGWDFDVESMQVAEDGTLWFGDEFGPYLLHADAQGRLLKAPIKLPGAIESRPEGGGHAPGEHRPDRGHGRDRAGTGEVSWVDSMVLPDELRTVEGIPFGGLSGLDYRPEQDAYLALSDDRSQQGPARFHELELPFDGTGFDEEGYAVNGTTVIERADGSAYPESTVDPESIRWDENTATALWADEGDADQGIDPAVRETTEEGQFVREFEVPAQYLLQYDEDGEQIAGVRNNLAFESLTLSPDGRTFSVMNEGALVQDGPIARPEHGTRLRLARFDRESGCQTAQYVYETEPMSSPAGSEGGDRGAPEILQLSATEYLVIERQFYEGVNEIQVYKATTDGATEVSGLGALTGGETMMSKELLIGLEVADVMPGNVEAITFGPRFDDGDRSLVLVADDNFNVKTQDTVFHLLRVDTER